MKQMLRFVASAVAVALVAAGLPTAISQAAQGSGDERKAFLAALAAAETGDAIAQFNRAISQLSQEVLAAVCNRAKLCKTEESAGAFDGMDRTKDTRKTLGVAWIFLQCDQVLVELVEILRRLNEKFPHKFFVLIHKKVVGAISLWSAGEH